MTNRDDLEYNKFELSSGLVKAKAVEGVSPATALLGGNLDTLELKKFTNDGSVRIITSF